MKRGNWQINITTLGLFIIGILFVASIIDPSKSFELILGAYSQNNQPSSLADFYVATNPSDANILLDGVQQAKTPTTFTNLIAGAHSFSITKSGYRDYITNNFVINSGEKKIVNIQLTPLGYLTATSNPRGASVFIDGFLKGLTQNPDSSIVFDLDVGTHSVKLTKVGYEDYLTTVTIRQPEQMVSLDAQLTQK
ncbi:PEGA domain-containing protein [Candidatus Woesearchaeota archaeon]|nr:PEGA domain-containing protein [Candidatus Woesearchaeota archaeon]